MTGGADKCGNDDLLAQASWLALHVSLLQDAEYLQMSTADFTKHAAEILKLLVELQQLRRKHK